MATAYFSNEFEEFFFHGGNDDIQIFLFLQPQFLLSCVFFCDSYPDAMKETWETRLIQAIEAALESGDKITDITKRSGVNRNQVDDMLRKGTRPRVDTFLKICQGLDVDPIYILTGINMSTETGRLIRLFSAMNEDRQKAFLRLLDEDHS